jgi:archaemetzincin
MGIKRKGILEHHIFRPAFFILLLATGFFMSGSDSISKATKAQLEFALTDDSDFQRLKDARPGDWRHAFYEPGQSFQNYVRSRPVRPDEKRGVLVFQPVGPFPEDKQELLKEAVKFAGIWFGLPTRIEDEIPLPERGWQRTRRFPWQKKPVVQYKTSYFLDKVLPPRMPDDAVAYLAVTMGDLYPDESWNYVFGQASLRHRVGVYSIVRYFPEFWGQPQDSVSRELAQKRICKVLVHEAGHIFGILHCQEYACTMNGSNSLEESDRRPLRLCPLCLRKLQWNLGFDVIQRYENLLQFYQDHNFREETEWTKGRIDKIQSYKK